MNTKLTNQELEAIAREYRIKQQQQKAIDAELELLKATMIAEMDCRQVDSLPLSEYTIRYTLVESERLDSKALKAASPELYKQFSKKSVSPRFQVA